MEVKDLETFSPLESYQDTPSPQGKVRPYSKILLIVLFLYQRERCPCVCVYVFQRERCPCVCVCVRARVYVCVCELLSPVRLFATPWTVALKAPLSMEFFRQEYWSG